MKIFKLPIVIEVSVASPYFKAMIIAFARIRSVARLAAMAGLAAIALIHAAQTAQARGEPILDGPTEPIPLPDDLKVDDKPINPLCFVPLFTAHVSDALPLRDCDKRGLIAMHNSDYQPQPGAIGRAMRFDGKEPAPFSDPAFIEYRYLGPYKAAQALRVEWSDGDSRSGASLLLTHREKDMLVIDQIVVDGSKTGNSVNDAVVRADGRLAWRTDITPFQMMTLDGRDAADADAYDSLDSCAQCGYGEVNFEDGTLTEIIFDKGLLDILRAEDMSEMDPVQACFDRNLKDYLDHAVETRLPIDEFRILKASIVDACLGGPWIAPE